MSLPSAPLVGRLIPAAVSVTRPAARIGVVRRVWPARPVQRGGILGSAAYNGVFFHTVAVIDFPVLGFALYDETNTWGPLWDDTGRVRLSLGFLIYTDVTMPSEASLLAALATASRAINQISGGETPSCPWVFVVSDDTTHQAAVEASGYGFIGAS